ncbi:hypothetical protein GCM10019016_037520 [Streptomyces prasinosporus]|uniref:Uncharacterized protein n=1 Tax=Streptomyces prasinosporus TaxID=68256 RepID=A0ABP6TQE9_9ACTN
MPVEEIGEAEPGDPIALRASWTSPSMIPPSQRSRSQPTAPLPDAGPRPDFPGPSQEDLPGRGLVVCACRAAKPRETRGDRGAHRRGVPFPGRGAVPDLLAAAGVAGLAVIRPPVRDLLNRGRELLIDGSSTTGEPETGDEEPNRPVPSRSTPVPTALIGRASPRDHGR